MVLRAASLAALLFVLAGCSGTPGQATGGDDAGAEGDAGSDAAVDGHSPLDGDAGGDGEASPSDVADAPGACVLVADPGLASSKWAAIEADGTLSYATLPTGERLLDFSWAGYEGGGVALPKADVKQTLKPSGGDDTAAIQGALDAVAKLPVVDHLRGAVLLEAGTFHVAGALSIHASGVVLRGSGSGIAGTTGTTLSIEGTPRVGLTIAGTGSWATTGPSATITDAYVPAGARTFQVDAAAAFKVGDAVLVDRPVTAAWVHLMGMDALVRGGKPETWLSEGTLIHSDRVITAIAGNAITVDAPLADSLDAKYVAPGAKVTRYAFAGRIDHAGVESLRLVAPKLSVPIDQPNFTAITMDAIVDGFIRDVATSEFNAGIVLSGGAKWITVEDSTIDRTSPIDNTAGYPFQLSVAGQQTLVQRCSTSGDDAFAYASQARTPGPNVVLGLSAKGTKASIQPHQRWSTGLLVDSSSDTDAIDFIDRGYFGSGHGWTIGFGVVWNSTAGSLVIEQPPGAQNWGIGLTGKLETMAEPGSTSTAPMPQGIIDSFGKPVAPKSLYLAQLCLRLGPAAVKNIGD